MSIYKQISGQVRNFRIKRGLSQQELAEMSNISQNFLNRIENHKENPSFETLENISKALQVSLATILAGATSHSELDNDIAKISIAYNKLSSKRKR